MGQRKKIAFLFPGQGAQYPGMGKEFIDNFPTARMKLEEADDLLKRNLSSIILEGPEAALTQTRNSQTGIFVIGLAILAVVKEHFPHLNPFACAGLSLGEYTALTAAGFIPFHEALPLVQYRGEFMNEACEATKGAMAVILGLNADQVEKLVEELRMPQDLWVANFNCPGQIVISGTLKGIEAGAQAAKERGAKRVLPLQVHGAFHSGLMQQAEERLTPYIQQASLSKSTVQLAMNVPGAFVEDLNTIRRYLIQQVTHSVRWEQSVRAMDQQGADLFIEFGPGNALTGMNKKIEPRAPTVNINKIQDLEILAKELG